MMGCNVVQSSLTWEAFVEVRDKDMMASGRRWTVYDRYNNEVYLTHERWEHITDPINHPEMAAYEEHVQDTIRSGERRQDALQPQKSRYMKAFDDLAAENTHLVAIVLCGFSEGKDGKPLPNNYIVIAYQQEIG